MATPITTINTSTGNKEYNNKWMILFGVLFSVLVVCVMFFVLKKFSVKAVTNRPVVSSSRDRLEEIRMSGKGSTLSDQDAAKSALAYFNEIGPVAGESSNAFLQRGSDSSATYSNTDERFGLFSNAESQDRVRRVGVSAGANVSPYSINRDDSQPVARRPQDPGESQPQMRKVASIGWGVSRDESSSASGGGSGSSVGLGSSPADMLANLERMRTGATTLGAAGQSAASQPLPFSQDSSFSGRDMVSADSTVRRARQLSANSVPTGTPINVVLVNNVISSSLRQRVWAITVQELVFRRQVQLPRGVMFGGHASSSPVRDMLDVTFDIVVFPDGTELSFSGHAVNVYNPSRPGLEGMRGLVDLYREPPLWSQFAPVLIEAVMGYTDVAYPENMVVSSSGEQTVSSRVQGNKAIHSSAAILKSQILGYLERYAPYVHLRKGLPFSVVMDSTVDFSKRQLGGFSYEDLLEQVSIESNRSLALAAARDVSAPEYFGMSGTTSPSDMSSKLRDIRLGMAAASAAGE
jgi:hypothetical protein